MATGVGPVWDQPPVDSRGTGANDTGQGPTSRTSDDLPGSRAYAIPAAHLSGTPRSRGFRRPRPGRPSLYGAVIAIEREIPLHFHPVFDSSTFSRDGLALDAEGREIPIGPGGAVLSPAGPAGAHGYLNTGTLPLTLLCVFPAPGGIHRVRTALEPGEDRRQELRRPTWLPSDANAPPTYPGAPVTDSSTTATRAPSCTACPSR